jgi:hypothetical protein
MPASLIVIPASLTVILAKAGIHPAAIAVAAKWIPAFAGMT